MRKLWYIFWAMPVFFAGCCCDKQIVILRYRPEVLMQETATPRPPSAVFDPPYLAGTNIFGTDEVAGLNLNQRAPVTSFRGYQTGEVQSYQYDYVDYYGGGGGGWGGCGGCGGWWGGPSSTTYYSRSGAIYR